MLFTTAGRQLPIKAKALDLKDIKDIVWDQNW
jgi:hypothetical protein